MCFTPFMTMKLLNSADTNCRPLSDTTYSGMPYHANMSRRTAIVRMAAVLVMGVTSGHFECASVTINIILPMKGAA